MIAPRPHRTTLAALIFLAALCLNLLGNGRHSLWDRDEPRYAEASREMLAGGDWVVPHFNGEVRYDKPVLIYWLMMAPMRLFGVNDFSVRAAQSLAGAGTVLLVFVLAGWLGAGAGAALVAASAAMLCTLLLVIAKASTTDAVLTLTVVAAMTLYWGQRTRGFSWLRMILFWAVLAISVLTKGPIGPMVIGLGIATYALWEKWVARRSDPTAIGAAASAPSGVPSLALRVLAGLGVFLLLTLPWGWLVSARTHGEFLRVAIGHHVVERSVKSFEGHRGPLVYYLPVLLAGTFPATALFLLGLRWGWGRRRLDPRARFLLAWFLPGLLVFSLARTKLPHYISPLLPALALLAALWWNARGENDAQARPIGIGWWRAGALLTGLVGLGAGLALPGVLIWSKIKVDGLLVPAVLIGLILGGSSVAGAVYWWSRRPRPAWGIWAGGMATTMVLLMLWAAPCLEPIRPAKMLTGWLKQNAPATTELLAVAYQEPSLVFYWARPVTMMGKSERAEVLARLADQARPAALVIPEKRWKKWLKDPQFKVPPRVSVRQEQRVFHFQRGKADKLIIVGNW